MPKINKYVDISEVDREAKKDLIDRHSPFIHCADTATAGEPFEVTVKMGNEYTHPDDFDHFIESVLFSMVILNWQKLLTFQELLEIQKLITQLHLQLFQQEKNLS